MTDQLWMIKDFTPFDPGSRWVNGIGHTRSPVLGQGNIDIVTSVNGHSHRRMLRDALYAPAIGVNLFSVGVAASGGADVHFTDSQAFIERDGIHEMSATKIGDHFYTLDIFVQ